MPAMAGGTPAAGYVQRVSDRGGGSAPRPWQDRRRKHPGSWPEQTRQQLLAEATVTARRKQRVTSIPGSRRKAEASLFIPCARSAWPRGEEALPTLPRPGVFRVPSQGTHLFPSRCRSAPRLPWGPEPHRRRVQPKGLSAECSPGRPHSGVWRGGLEVGSRWRGAEPLSCCVAGEGRPQLGEGREELEAWQSFCFAGPQPAQKQRRAIQLGPGALGAYGPERGCAGKHPRRGAMCTHGGPRQPRPEARAALHPGEFPGSSPCCVPAGSLAALSGAYIYICSCK